MELRGHIRHTITVTRYQVPTSLINSIYTEESMIKEEIKREIGAELDVQKQRPTSHSKLSTVFLMSAYWFKAKAF
jgi:hypothetical protein